MKPAPEPSLAPPGAGLPPVELFFARLAFRGFVWKGSRESFTAKFERERQKIRELVAACDEATGSRRVLIRRLPGLEDSSRHWSVWMTLDHLRIVHGSLRQVIIALRAGRAMPGAASTAAVKPAAGVASSVMAAYETSCDDLLATASKAPDLKTALTFPHPWFGPLTAYEWYAMAGFHLGLHRAQIQRILRGLGDQSRAG